MGLEALRDRVTTRQAIYERCRDNVDNLETSMETLEAELEELEVECTDAANERDEAYAAYQCALKELEEAVKQWNYHNPRLPGIE